MAILDHKIGYEQGPNAPYTRASAITPTNGADLAFRTTAIWVGGAGNLALVLSSGDTVTFTAVPAGTLIRVRADQVPSTGTTATNLVALS